ncbi:ATP-binding protein [Kitasatospora sp. NPDC094015]|uniref:ATP-binding protein n=1 Tax=Kitasatospora sp. NPDC094015 TaxID=3155205 RepID=UPI00332E657F
MSSGPSSSTWQRPPGAALPAAGQRRSVLLAGLPRQVSRARAFTREALADWGRTDPEEVEDLLLLVNELVANALLHAGGAQRLTLHATAGGRLRIEVADGLRTPPVMSRPHRPGQPGGHGMHIVQRLADAWGVAEHDSGKTVWAEVGAPAAAAPEPSYPEWVNPHGGTGPG